MARSKQQSILASAPGTGELKRFVLLLNTEDYWSASLLEGRQKVGWCVEKRDNLALLILRDRSKPQFNADRIQCVYGPSDKPPEELGRAQMRRNSGTPLAPLVVS